MLGGRYLGREDIVDVGAELVDSCRAVYEATETRIGPEMWMWSREGQFVPREKEHVEQAKRAGWWAVDGRYNLRPGEWGGMVELVEMGR